MRVSLQLIPEQPIEELLAAVQVADELGYYACYSADEIYHKDAWLLLAAAAVRTERIRLGPCVAPVFLRDPTYVAQLAATLDELSGGRAEVVATSNVRSSSHPTPSRIASSSPAPPRTGSSGSPATTRRSD